MSIKIDGVLETVEMEHFYDAMDKENSDWVPETNQRFIKITSEGGNYVLGKLIYRTPKPDGNFYGVDKDVWELIAEHIPKLERPQTLQGLISKVKEIAEDWVVDDYVILASFFYSGVGAVPRILYEQAVEAAANLNYQPLSNNAYGGLIAHLCWYKVNSESPDKVNGDPLVKDMKSKFNGVVKEIYENFDPNNISTWPSEKGSVYKHYESLYLQITDITKGITKDVKEMKDAITEFSNKKKGGNLTRRKATKRKASKRKASKRKASKRKAIRRKSMKRKNFKRKATRRKNTRRRNYIGRSIGGGINIGDNVIIKNEEDKGVGQVVSHEISRDNKRGVEIWIPKWGTMWRDEDQVKII